tara:strand:- start:128 stop:649 length:522 start_codon:yes stop_codon:yes gene_type:complete
MIPNLLSISRVLLLIPIIYLVIIDNTFFTLIIFSLAGFTDFLDGYVARLMRQESILGANLDLLADKIFICTLTIFLAFHFDNWILLLSAILITSRELTIGIVRNFYLEMNNVNTLKVNIFGKLKTFFQIMSLGFALVFLETKYNFFAEIVIFTSSILSWISLASYVFNRKQVN